jgi:hypothetical protein
MTSRAGAKIVVYLGFFACITVAIGVLGWERGWSMFGEYPLSPPFFDLRHLQGAVVSVEQGYNPYIENPGDPRGIVLNYPPIWLAIGRLLSLDRESNLVAFAAFVIGCFMASVVYFMRLFPSWLLLFASISGAALMGVERANLDILMFAIVFFALLLKSDALRAATIFVAAVLKLFPIFAAVCFLPRRAAAGANWSRLLYALAIGLLFAGYLLIYHADIRHVLVNTEKAGAGAQSYGVWVLNFLANERFPQLGVSEPLIYTAFAIALVAILSFFRPLTSLLQTRDSSNGDLDFAETLFLAGGGIYVVSFLTAANWDYRMIFCLLTIPFLLRMENVYVRWLFAICLLLGLNYFLLVSWGGAFGGAVNMLSKTALQIMFMSILIIKALQRLRPSLVEAEAEPQE